MNWMCFFHVVFFRVGWLFVCLVLVPVVEPIFVLYAFASVHVTRRAPADWLAGYVFPHTHTERCLLGPIMA